MKETEVHPNEGDTLALTGVVHNRAIAGLPLPAGYRFADSDQTFDEYLVEVTNIKQIRVGFDERLTREILTLETEDGDTAKVSYRGRERIAGRKGQSLSTQNSQGANQSYNWHKVE